MMNECAGGIATRPYAYDNRSREHAPPRHPTPRSSQLAVRGTLIYLSPRSAARVSSMLLTGSVKIAHTSNEGELPRGAGPEFVMDALAGSGRQCRAGAALGLRSGLRMTYFIGRGRTLPSDAAGISGQASDAFASVHRCTETYVHAFMNPSTTFFACPPLGDLPCEIGCRKAPNTVRLPPAARRGCRAQRGCCLSTRR